MNKNVLIALPLIALLAVGATALAQVTDNASSTEIEATTTVSTETLESPDASVATTTTPVEGATDASTSDEVATSTTGEATTTPEVSQEVAVPVKATLPTPTANSVATAQDIAGLEAGYFKQSGKYLQILPGNQLPGYETGAVTDKLGAAIRSDARVDVYESAGGAGYQITFQDGNTVYSFGYGPEWVERTYAYAIPTAEASSTPAVAQ